MEQKHSINLTDVSAFDEIANPISIVTQNGKLKIISACVKGDVNGDGVIKSNDVILALRISAGIITPDQIQFCAADYNDDGVVKSNDAILILRKSVGNGSTLSKKIYQVIPLNYSLMKLMVHREKLLAYP